MTDHDTPRDHDDAPQGDLPFDDAQFDDAQFDRALQALMTETRPDEDAAIGRARVTVLAHLAAGPVAAGEPTPRGRPVLRELPAGVVPIPPRRAVRRRARIGVFAGAAAVAAAALVAGVSLVGAHGGGAGRGVSTVAGSGLTDAVGADGTVGSASVLLVRAADVRTRTGDVSLAPGQYRYVRVIGPAPTVIEAAPAGGTPGAPQAPAAGAYSLEEIWIPQDQSQEWLRRDTVVGADAPGYPMVFRGLCGDFYAHTQDGSVGRTPGDSCTRPADLGDPSPAFIASLPRDPAQLLTLLQAYAAAHLNPEKVHDVDAAVLGTVEGLLSSGMVPSDLTAGLYTAMSRIPGITAVPDTKNAAGVSGTGFRLTSTTGSGASASVETDTVIVDLTTGAYLGYREVADGLDYLNAVTVGTSDVLGGSAG